MLIPPRETFDELGGRRVLENVTAAKQIAADMREFRDRATKAVAALDPQLRDDVLQTKERELRDRLQTEAGTKLGEANTFAALDALTAQADRWAGDRWMQRVRYTAPTDADNNLEREAAVATRYEHVLLPRLTSDELLDVLDDALDRKVYALAAAVKREARARAGNLTDNVAQQLSTNVEERIAKAEPPKAIQTIRAAIAEAAQLRHAIETDFKLIGRRM